MEGEQIMFFMRNIKKDYVSVKFERGEGITVYKNKDIAVAQEEIIKANAEIIYTYTLDDGYRIPIPTDQETTNIIYANGYEINTDEKTITVNTETDITISITPIDNTVIVYTEPYNTEVTITNAIERNGKIRVLRDENIEFTISSKDKKYHICQYDITKESSPNDDVYLEVVEYTEDQNGNTTTIKIKSTDKLNLSDADTYITITAKATVAEYKINVNAQQNNYNPIDENDYFISTSATERVNIINPFNIHDLEIDKPQLYAFINAEKYNWIIKSDYDNIKIESLSIFEIDGKIDGEIKQIPYARVSIYVDTNEYIPFKTNEDIATIDIDLQAELRAADDPLKYNTITFTPSIGNLLNGDEIQITHSDIIEKRIYDNELNNPISIFASDGYYLCQVDVVDQTNTSVWRQDFDVDSKTAQFAIIPEEFIKIDRNLTITTKYYYVMTVELTDRHCTFNGIETITSIWAGNLDTVNYTLKANDDYLFNNANLTIYDERGNYDDKKTGTLSDKGKYLNFDTNVQYAINKPVNIKIIPPHASVQTEFPLQIKIVNNSGKYISASNKIESDSYRIFFRYYQDTSNYIFYCLKTENNGTEYLRIWDDALIYDTINPGSEYIINFDEQMLRWYSDEPPTYISEFSKLWIAHQPVIWNNSGYAVSKIDVSLKIEWIPIGYGEILHSNTISYTNNTENELELKEITTLLNQYEDKEYSIPGNFFDLENSRIVLTYTINSITD